MAPARPIADFASPPAASPVQRNEPSLPHEALPAGTRIGGYQIIEVLGRGGFGIVYLALDSSLQRQVAIKEYMPSAIAVRCENRQVWVRSGSDATAYSAGMAEFLKEAKMLARFDHPSLTRVHSFWEENRTGYLAMPYYDGPTLAAKLRSLPHPPSEAWLRALLAPLLDALSVLHNAQCFHRDISPDNIILLANDRPVLLDFGVALRAVGDKTMPLTELLNPAYAPIEQYSESAGLPQGPWTDLYALGGVLHFAITGQAPARATVRAIADPQRPLAEVLKTLQLQFPGLRYSDSFLAAIDKALAVKPQDRPRNVPEFQLLLDNPAPPVVATPVVVPVAAAALPASPQALPPQAPVQAAMPAPATQAPAASQPVAPAAVTPPVANSPSAQAAAPEAAPSLSSFTAGFSAKPEEPDYASMFDPTMLQIPGIEDQDESRFDMRRPRDEWSAYEQPARPPSKRAGGPSWISGTLIAILVAGGAWWWANTMGPLRPAITMADIPTDASILAPRALPEAPTGAGPAATAAESTAAHDAAVDAAIASARAQSTQAETTLPATTPPVTTPPVTTPPVTTPPVTTSSAVTPPPAERPVAARATPPVARAAPVKPAPAAAPVPVPAPAQDSTVTAALEANNPRAVCGTRTNFALFYCMQTQCKRDKFAMHAQCIELKRRGDLD